MAEFEKLPDDDNLHELDERELIATPPRGWRHGMVQAAALSVLGQATRKTGCGMVLGRCGFQLAPNVVQAPEVAFIREERRAKIPRSRDPVPRR